MDSLTVTWAAGEGERSGFIVKLEPRADNNVNSDTMTWTFDKLDSGTTYTVTVVTKSGVQRSEPLTESFYTSKFM